jgi:hypothetical protein
MIGGIVVLFICITRLASNEIFSPSKKIHCEVCRTKDLSAPLYDDTKPEVIENNICEGTDCLKATLCSGMTGLQVVVASARSVCRGSKEAVTLLYLVPCPSTPTYRVKIQYSNHYDYHHCPQSTLT